MIVISGPSRRAYHGSSEFSPAFFVDRRDYHHAFLVRFSGVPRVLDGTLPDHFKLPEMDGEDTWDPAFFTYLETTRCASLSISSSHR